MRRKKEGMNEKLKNYKFIKEYDTYSLYQHKKYDYKECFLHVDVYKKFLKAN